jgi:transcriptional regulator with GAF, ATPase, and Fis domain
MFRDDDSSLRRARKLLGPTRDAPVSKEPLSPIEALPGVVVIFADGRPARRLFPVGRGTLALGRIELASGDTLDESISREHARLAFDGTRWKVTDLGSRNGTLVNGTRIEGEKEVPSGTMIRVGGALLLAVSDVRPFERWTLGIHDDIVAGPALMAELESIALASREGMVTSLLVIGETGTGKEIAAQTFHDAAKKRLGPFIALNCAAIPKDLAERLLFGSRRGAFSGATDAQGHVQAANEGTLFLDEIAELPLDMQSKLLRMLETREVIRLGATTPEKVDVRVVAATFRDLRGEVGAGRFREDLYFRIAQAQIRLPPLRERIDEIPWHVQHILDDCRRDGELGATAGFVEACATRVWPGNVRELRAEVRRAAASALAKGMNLLRSEDIAPTAGMPIVRSGAPEAPPDFPNDDFAAALAEAQGNVVLAAKNLGVHRNKVRRWLERYRVDAARFKRRTL